MLAELIYSSIQTRKRKPQFKREDYFPYLAQRKKQAARAKAAKEQMDDDAMVRAFLQIGKSLNARGLDKFEASIQQGR